MLDGTGEQDEEDEPAEKINGQTEVKIWRQITRGFSPYDNVFFLNASGSR
jgi:hypothetical protein